MSQQALNAVLDRALLDEDFREGLADDPALLDEFELTDDEREALVTRNLQWSTSLAGGPYAGLTFVRVFVLTITTNNNIVVLDRKVQEDPAQRAARLESLAQQARMATEDREERLRELLAAMR